MAYFGVAGPGYHKAEIRRLYERGGPFVATLVREPGNKHDRNAVRVDIDGLVVGYVPKDMAPAFHQVVADLAQRQGAARVPAEIDWGDRGQLEVVIDVPI